VTDDLALDSADDVNTIDDEDGHEDDDAGNRVSGGTPLAVVTYLVNSIASEPDAVVINTVVAAAGARDGVRTSVDIDDD
jgi:hypothetical protein